MRGHVTRTEEPINFEPMEEQQTLVSKAARLADRRLEWNEIDFVGWPEFRRMAPIVVGLEIGRIEQLVGESDIAGEFYNALIRVRFALRNFVDGIEASEKESAQRRAKFLEQALLNLSTAIYHGGDRQTETIRYVAHRLSYIHNRLKLIY